MRLYTFESDVGQRFGRVDCALIPTANIAATRCRCFWDSKLIGWKSIGGRSWHNGIQKSKIDGCINARAWKLPLAPTIILVVNMLFDKTMLNIWWRACAVCQVLRKRSIKVSAPFCGYCESEMESLDSARGRPERVLLLWQSSVFLFTWSRGPTLFIYVWHLGCRQFRQKWLFRTRNTDSDRWAKNCSSI